MNVFDLQAKISLDDSGFTKGLSGAAGKAKSFVKVGFGAVVAGSAIVAGAFTKAAKSTADYGDKVDKMSQKIGISAESYQKWDYVMKRAGGSVDSLKMGMKTLSKQAESNSDAFQKLGISQEEVKKSSQEELFEKTVKGLSKMEAGTERAALASQLLGRAGADLGPLLNEGSDAIEEQMKIAEKYGMVMPDSAVKASAAFKDSVTTMQMTFAGLRNRLMSEFLPSITKVTDGLASMFAGDYNKGIKQISKGITGFVENISEVLPKVLQVGAQLVQSLGNAIVKNLPELSSASVKIITTIITDLINNLPMLIDSAGQIVTTIATGIAEAIPKIIDALVQAAPAILQAGKQLLAMLVSGISQNAPALISKAAEWIANLVKGIMTALPQLLTAAANLLRQFVEKLKSNLPQFIEAAAEWLRSLIQGIVENLPELISAAFDLAIALLEAVLEVAPMLIKAGFELLNNIVLGIKDGIASVLAPVADSIKDRVMSAINALKGALSAAWGAIKGAASAAWNGIKSVAGSVWNAVKSAVMRPVNALKSSLSGAWSAIKGKASSMWDAIKSAVTKPFDTAKQKILDAVDKIKSLFPISLGKIFKGIINLPFIKVNKKKDGADTSGGTKEVSFAKAMNQPYLFDGPTFFKAGEAGDEMLYGKKSLMNDIADVVGGKGRSIVNNFYLTVNGSDNPEDWGRRFVKEIELQTRMA